jgi:very-short-patch-repair endonuclease
MKPCENCGNSHDGQYGSGRFCSSICARGFSTKENRKHINEKVSRTLTGRPSNGSWEKYNRQRYGDLCFEKKIIHCLSCETEMKIGVNCKTRFCSKSCASSYSQKKLAKEGRHNGFPSRLDKKPSWAEQFTIDLFNQEKIKFVRDYKINRFFADFAFIDKRVILEIDGKQHIERKDYDINRDLIITAEGWTVIRIPWKHRDFKLMELSIREFINDNL